MLCFPMFMKLKDRTVLICGSTEKALDKLRRLLPFEPNILLISADVSELSGLPQTVRLEKHTFCVDDLACKPAFVIAAEDRIENQRIARICRAQHVPVNAVDQPEDCDFLFPAMVSAEPLSIGICTAGVCPSAAVELKDRIRASLPDSTDQIIIWLSQAKQLLRTQVENSSVCRKILRQATAMAFDLGRPLTDEELVQLIP